MCGPSTAPLATMDWVASLPPLRRKGLFPSSERHLELLKHAGRKTPKSTLVGWDVKRPNLNTNVPDSYSDKVPGGEVPGILPFYLVTLTRLFYFSGTLVVPTNILTISLLQMVL